jgi:hypothetical protein
VCGNGAPEGRRHEPRDAATPRTAEPSPATASADPPVRPEEGVTVVVRVDHRGAGARRPTDGDAAVRFVAERTAGRTRIGTLGAALPLRTSATWHLPAPSGAWLEVVEGAAVDETVVLRPAGGAAFDAIVDAGRSARVTLSAAGADDPMLRNALAPLVAASVGQADVSAVASALSGRPGGIRGWEVRWQGRPAVAWTVETSRRETMMLAEPEGDEVPAPLRLSAGAAESAAALAGRFGAAVDERAALQVKNAGRRTMLFYVRGRLVGWVAPGAGGSFLGLPPGRHPAFATTLRGTESAAATVTVPGDWTIGQAASSPTADR